VVLHRAILRDCGHVLDERSLVLDFGCGHGELVAAYRHEGIPAFGADVLIEKPGPWLRAIDPRNYRLPFPDAMFDVVVSNYVVEHVENLSIAATEIARVLKPGGASLHFFPPPARLIEPHVFVPLAGVVRAPWWLRLWALCGVRNSFQRQLSWREVAHNNAEYLATKTFYRSKRSFRQIFSQSFATIRFADESAIRHSYGHARFLAPVAQVVGGMYGAFHQRCLFLEKP